MTVSSGTFTATVGTLAAVTTVATPVFPAVAIVHGDDRYPYHIFAPAA